jgi:hypothetical protein
MQQNLVTIYAVTTLHAKPPSSCTYFIMPLSLESYSCEPSTAYKGSFTADHTSTVMVIMASVMSTAWDMSQENMWLICFKETQRN